jgi:hypothetical protein
MPRLRPLEERFWDKVERTETCWLWTGATRRGYGHLFPNKVAHRLAYEWLVGPIPDGLTLDHLCGVKRCVNPSHLEAVTIGENVRRYYGVITHCPRGHEYSRENLIRHNRWGRGMCRLCQRQQQRERRAERRAA